jgi:hypothetical protein
VYIRHAPRQFFGIAFWIGFLLHLILTEYWLQASGSKRENIAIAN